jgi:hypothetical protein
MACRDALAKLVPPLLTWCAGWIDPARAAREHGIDDDAIARVESLGIVEQFADDLVPWNERH